MWPINNLEENNFIKFLQSKIVVEVYLANGYLLMSISNFGLSIIFVQISVRCCCCCSN
jgi:membrane protein insertase Oxa1/YidC/SpoIIIJ